MTSVKKYIVLTGPPGIGKTTLVMKICNILQGEKRHLTGFYTEEVRDKNRRVGFDIVSIDGNRVPLARLGPTGDTNRRSPTVGKYVVDIASFESIALPNLDHLETNNILVIDEIGKMELFSKPFKERITQIIRETNVIILATIPEEKGAPIPLLTAIRSHHMTKMFEVNRNNRDGLVEEILDDLRKQLD